jgi:hypothetical protein
LSRLARYEGTIAPVLQTVLSGQYFFRRVVDELDFAAVPIEGVKFLV